MSSLPLFVILSPLFSLMLPVAWSATKVKPSSVIPAKREFPLNTAVNACEDFNKYVCSQVEASFKLRDDRSSHTFAFDDSSERILELKKSFFKNINKETKLDDRASQLKNVYAACMNVPASTLDEKQHIAELIKEADQIQNISQLLELSHGNIAKGRYSFLVFDKTQNILNPNAYDAYVGVNLMKLPDHSYYDNKELMSAYRDLISSFFAILYPKMDADKIASRVEAMIQLEIGFKDIYPKPEIRRQRWSEKREFAKKKFVSDFSNLKFDSVLGLIPDSTLLRIPIPEGVQFLSSVATPENFASLRDIYLYRSGSPLMDDAYPKFFKKRFEFSRKYFGGPEKRPVRQERCTESVMASFAKELDQVMLPRLFPNFPEQKLMDVAGHIRDAILKGVENNSWLSKEAKAEALKKMKLARLQLVKPRNDREWDFNPILEYSKTEPLRNQEKLAAAWFQKTLKEIPESANLDAWEMGPLTVNAYYDPSQNKFVMPIGILQYPFFNPEGSLLENLGAVGAVVGHELGHGIDDQGSKFDNQGKLKQWMSMKDLAEFTARGNKLILQFNQAGHNGALTLGENVADLVGLTFAYRAAFPDGKGTVEDKQKLFVSYARVWCGVKRPKLEERLLKTDPHAMGWARINEQMKHQPAFAEAFSCKPGDKMTLPEAERVSIW